MTSAHAATVSAVAILFGARDKPITQPATAPALATLSEGPTPPARITARDVRAIMRARTRPLLRIRSGLRHRRSVAPLFLCTQ